MSPEEPITQACESLMVEHRLIERMIALIRDALDTMQSSGRADPHFVDSAIDFVNLYADRAHHGKEEDIFYRTLAERRLSADDRRTMKELIQEHLLGRRTTRALADANARYRNGDSAAFSDIAVTLRTLVDFYPRHMEREEQVFFRASGGYISAADDRSMLAEFREFDRKMLLEQFTAVVEEMDV